MAIVTYLPASVDLGRLASIEVAVSLFLEQILLVPLSPEDRAKLCQAAEENFTQVQQGIMDKFVICCAQKDTIMYCHSREKPGEYIPFNASVIVCNPGVKPKSIPSWSNVLAVLQTVYPNIHSLNDVDTCQVNLIKDSLGDDLYKMAIHCISECQRAAEGKQALLRGDYESVGGSLMYSFVSFRDMLKASCDEIDGLSELIAEEESVYGIRMNEEGEVLILVERSQEKRVARWLEQEYKKRFGKVCKMIACYPSDGAKIISTEKTEVGTYSKWKNPWLWACAATVVGVGVMMFMHSRHCFVC